MFEHQTVAKFSPVGLVEPSDEPSGTRKRGASVGCRQFQSVVARRFQTPLFVYVFRCSAFQASSQVRFFGGLPVLDCVDYEYASVVDMPLE